VAIIPEDGIVAIARSNREDNLNTIRAIMSDGVEPMTLAIGSSSSNSIFFKLLLSLSFIIDVELDESDFL